MNASVRVLAMRPKNAFLLFLSLLLTTGCATTPPQETPMTTPSPSLGYVILYVEDVAEPTQKPWGQTVAYLRDNQGFLIEICSPLP
jgi:hypothetical protein